MLFEIEVKDELAAKEFIDEYNEKTNADLNVVAKKGTNKLKILTEKLSQAEVVNFAIAYGRSEQFLTKPEK
jgi:hypothetical protein